MKWSFSYLHGWKFKISKSWTFEIQILKLAVCLQNINISSLFVWFDSLHPINNLSVIKGWVFLGWTSTKLGSICLAQGHSAVTLVRLQPTAPRSRVKHSTTEPLRSLYFKFKWLIVCIYIRKAIIFCLIQDFEADFLWKVSFKILTTFNHVHSLTIPL